VKGLCGEKKQRSEFFCEEKSHRGGSSSICFIFVATRNSSASLARLFEKDRVSQALRNIENVCEVKYNTLSKEGAFEKIG